LGSSGPIEIFSGTSVSGGQGGKCILLTYFASLHTFILRRDKH
jgi:hypothetical protein